MIEKDARLGLAAAGLTEINAQDNNLTDFGHSLKAVIKDRDFIDLGCGIPCPQNPAPKYVLAFGGNRYIGVDMSLTQEQIERHSNVSNQFQEIYVNDEMLRFLSRIPTSSTRKKGLVLFFSAIESNFDYNAYLRISRKKRKTALDKEFLEERRLKADYHRVLYSEIRRITGIGDAVIFGRRTDKMFPDYLLHEGFNRDQSSHACKCYRKI